MSLVMFCFLRVFYDLQIGTPDEDRCFSLYPVGNCIQVSEELYFLNNNDGKYSLTQLREH